MYTWNISVYMSLCPSLISLYGNDMQTRNLYTFYTMELFRPYIILRFIKNAKSLFSLFWSTVFHFSSLKAIFTFFPNRVQHLIWPFWNVNGHFNSKCDTRRLAIFSECCTQYFCVNITHICILNIQVGLKIRFKTISYMYITMYYALINTQLLLFFL